MTLGNRNRIFGTFVLVIFLNWKVTDGADTELKIGWVTKTRITSFNPLYNYGAIVMALEDIERDFLLPGYSFRILWRDGCSDEDGIYPSTEFYYIDDVDVIFGPPCSSGTIPVATLTSSWNLPHLTWVSTSSELADKSRFTTLGRTLPDFSKLAPFILELFYYFKWNRAVVLWSRSAPLCQNAAVAVDNILVANDMTVAHIYSFTDDISDAEMVRMLTSVKISGRNGDVERNFLLHAHDNAMTNGDYVFILPKLHSMVTNSQPWMYGDERDEDAKKAYETALEILFATPSGQEFDDFRDDIITKARVNPYNWTMPEDAIGSMYASYLYDAMYLYALAANKTLDMGGDLRNGSLMFQNMKGFRFRGKSGDVVINDDVEREPIGWIRDLRPSGHFEKIIEVQVNEDGTKQMVTINEPLWGENRIEAPRDMPECGFFDELCPPTLDRNMIITITILVLILVTSIVAVFYFVYRRKKREEELYNMLWKVNYSDIVFNKNRRHGSLISGLSAKSINSVRSNYNVSLGPEQTFTNIGFYRDNLVAIKRIEKDSITITRAILLEMKEMREMNHGNVNSFIGVCSEPPNMCILMQYCTKGSLQDILENDDIKLDWLFKTSLLSDVVMGMEYIHKSTIGSHGHLKSSNCVVDSRWVLKITDYALNRFKDDHKDIGEYAHYSSMLWTAPELLRDPNPPLNGTKKGDIYSFAIIIRETLTRNGGFDTLQLTPKDIIELIRKGGDKPYRPSVVIESDSTSEQSGFVNLMEDCWDEEADNRPTFCDIKRKVKMITHGKSMNIIDNILNMMEMYANNLEEIVEERTRQLIEEKKKTDRLLYNMLPKSVADKLKVGTRADPESYDHVTIFFSDIVGFTSFSAESTPMQVVDFLNDLYSMFDDTIVNFNVYKVETIGDAYMVVSGLPQRNGKRHAGEIANMALHLLSEVTTFKIRHLPERQLQLRVGIHTGACVAGIVGLTMPRYCLFGDTVNMASRMESNGQALRIHISESTHCALTDLGGYEMIIRGPITIKGKGVVTTYWLEGSDSFAKPLPTVKSSIAVMPSVSSA
ncbi:atrial natriuretic peptide receptor 1-like [Glandiceps talaboti]